ncbi:hypothetical protein OUZ56_010033 [Daphnia magna]|uniref:Uncharacterized protein n=1 Tax=Daphnia magna TaxID=35525 RepID=A0ABR0AHT4_9CRUS|nr:hypothetical protein OUZ56_010033 [Daphnia magna]
MSFPSGHLQYLFEDSIIISNAKIPRYVEEINILKPQKGYDNCGNSTYKAGKENTSRHRTQDETGLASACCRHEVVLVTANLKSGENYRIVNFFHHFLWTLDLLKVSEGHEMHVEWMLLTTLLVTSTSATTSFAIMMRMIKEMSGFLSVLHGRTHTWDFQVDNNGRWRDCACASLGEDEEQEQVFTRFARYGLVTKHMSPAFRNDHLSEVVVNHNKEKDYGMDYALVKRAKKAAFKEDETLKKLVAQLSRRCLNEQDLPANSEDFKNQGKEVACEEEALVTTGKRKETILPNSYKVDLEGHFMTAA